MTQEYIKKLLHGTWDYLKKREIKTKNGRTKISTWKTFLYLLNKSTLLFHILKYSKMAAGDSH